MNCGCSGSIGSIPSFGNCLTAGPGTVQGGRELREGNRLIQLRNSYYKQIFNGDIGRV